MSCWQAERRHAGLPAPSDGLASTGRWMPEAGSRTADGQERMALDGEPPPAPTRRAAPHRRAARATADGYDARSLRSGPSGDSGTAARAITRSVFRAS